MEVKHRFGKTCNCRRGGSLMGHTCSRCDGWEDITALRANLRIARAALREIADGIEGGFIAAVVAKEALGKMNRRPRGK